MSWEILGVFPQERREAYYWSNAYKDQDYQQILQSISLNFNMYFLQILVTKNAKDRYSDA